MDPTYDTSDLPVPDVSDYDPRYPELQPPPPASVGMAGIPVPKTQEEADQIAQRINASLTHFGSQYQTPAQKRAFDQNAALVRKSLDTSLAQFKMAQTRTGRAGTGGAPIAVPDGYMPVPRKFGPTGLSGDLMSANDLANEQEENRQKQMDAIERRVKAVTGGASVSEFLDDRGNYQDNTDLEPGPGKVTPNTHYFMRSQIGRDGEMRRVQQSIPEPLYRRLRAEVDPVFYGSDPKAPAGRNFVQADAPDFTPVATSAEIPAPKVVTPIVPVAPATDPTNRLKGLLSANAAKEESDDQLDARQGQNVDDAILRVQGKARKSGAEEIADRFDYSSVMPPRITDRARLTDYLDNNDPLREAAGRGSAFVKQLDDIARTAGIENYDRNEALRIIKKWRDQKILDALAANADPSTLTEAERLAAQIESRGPSLPTGNPSVIPGVTDRVIPNSGKQ